MPELFLTPSMAQTWAGRAREFLKGLKLPPSVEPQIETLERQIPQLAKARAETAEEAKRATEDALKFPSKTQDERAANIIRELAKAAAAVNRAEAQLKKARKDREKAQAAKNMRIYTVTLIDRLAKEAQAMQQQGKVFTKMEVPAKLYNVLKILGHTFYPEAPLPSPAVISPAIVWRPIFGPPIKVPEPPKRRDRPAPRDVVPQGVALPISGCYCRLFSKEDETQMDKYVKKAYRTSRSFFSFINEDYGLKGWVQGNSYDIPASTERRPGEEGIFVVHPSQGDTADMLTWSDIIQMGMRKWPCYCKGVQQQLTLPDPQTGEEKDWDIRRATCYSFAGTISHVAFREELPPGTISLLRERQVMPELRKRLPFFAEMEERPGVFFELREFPEDLKNKHMKGITAKDVKEKGREWFLRTMQERLDDEDRERWEFLKKGMAQLRQAIFGYVDEKTGTVYRGMEDIIAGCPISLGEELAKTEYAERIKVVEAPVESLEEARLREEAEETEAIEKVIEELKIPTEAPSE